MPYHYLLKLEKALPKPWGSETMWVKGDMISTVGFQRLELVRLKKGPDGKRRYIQPVLSSEELRKIKETVLHGLGFHEFLS